MILPWFVLNLEPAEPPEPPARSPLRVDPAAAKAVRGSAVDPFAAVASPVARAPAPPPRLRAAWTPGVPPHPFRRRRRPAA